MLAFEERARDGRILFKMKAAAPQGQVEGSPPAADGGTLRVLEVIANVQEYQDPIQFRSARYG
jgi:hypothetical protein